MFNHQWISSQSVIPSTRGERGCYKMTVSKSDDMRGQWGSNETTLAQRAQFASKFNCPNDSTQNFYFSILIPADWEFREQWVVVADLHGGNSWMSPWCVYVAGDLLKFCINEQKANNQIKGHYTDITLIPEQWYDFHITSHLDTDHSGYHTVICNGVEITNYSGSTVQNTETVGCYEKIGPYVHTTWDGVDYRTIYAILDSYKI